MKVSRNFFLWAVAVPLLAIGFTNCGEFAPVADLAALTANQTVAPEGEGQAAYQDRSFQFKPAAATSSGTYTISEKPAWASFDATTGTLSGIPSEPGFSRAFTITETATAKVHGPYYVNVLGNPMKQFQWHLQNIGQTTFSLKPGTTGEDLHLSQSLAQGLTGKGVKIAISDTGVFEAHPGLVKSMMVGASRNYLLDYAARGNSWIGDATPTAASVTSIPELAHGTAVAGLAAETGWTGFGGRGVAPEASIAGFLYIQAQNVLSTKNLDTAGYLDQFSGSFDIFNYSWGDPQCQITSMIGGLDDKLVYGTTTLRSSKGAIYIKAAGNEFTADLKDCDSSAAANAIVFGNVNFSEEYSTPYMITVAAVNAKGQSASYSSPGSAIWISAPGGEFGYDDSAQSTSVLTDPALLTTDYPGCDIGFKSFGANAFDRGGGLNADCYHTSRMNGTSGASPIVSGVVALLLQANPALTWRDVKHILATTADKVQPTSGATQHPRSTLNLTGHTYQLGWTTNAAGYPFHNWFGFGRVNVDRAVAMAKTYTSTLGTLKQTNPSSGTYKYSSGALNSGVPDASATGVTSTLSVTENYKIEAVQAAVSVQNCIGEIGIELTSPSGTKSVLLNINSQLTETALFDHQLLTNAFYGENSAGTWTLKIVDGRAGCQATFSSWKLNVIGH